MRYQPCDELAANLLAAEETFRLKLNFELAEDLITRVCNAYPSERDFEELLIDACNKECVEGDEQHAYKYALGLFFNCRAQVRIKEKRAINSVEFAPR